MIHRMCVALVLLGLLVPLAFALEQAPSQWNSTPEGFFFPGAGSYLGIDIRDITPDRVNALKLKEERGVEIVALDQDAPAAKAGLKEHDVILEYNGSRVEGQEQLRRLIRETPPGRTVALGVSRDGNPTTVNVQMGDRSKLAQGWQQANHNLMVIPPMQDFPQIDFGNLDIRGLSSSYSMGLQLEGLNEQLGKFFGVDGGKGLLVRSVEKGTAAEKAGVKAGDVIVRIDNEKIANRGDLRRILRSHPKGGKVTLGIIRDKREQNIPLDLPERKLLDGSSLFVDPSQFNGLRDKIAKLSEDQMLEIKPEIEKAMQQYRSQLGDMRKLYDSDKMRSLVEEQRKEIEKIKPEIDKAMQEYRKHMDDYRKQYEPKLQEQMKELRKMLKQQYV